MSSENLEDFEHFHFPATNCFSNMGWRERISAWDALVRHISLVSFNNRAVQTNCSDTCYISSKIWDPPLFRNAKLVFIGMSSENLQKNGTDTFQRPIPEMNRLKFPKYDLILQFISFHFSFIGFYNIFHEETFTKKIHIQNIMKIRIHFDNVIQNMIQTYHN